VHRLQTPLWAILATVEENVTEKPPCATGPVMNTDADGMEQDGTRWNKSEYGTGLLQNELAL